MSKAIKASTDPLQPVGKTKGCKTAMGMRPWGLSFSRKEGKARVGVGGHNERVSQAKAGGQSANGHTDPGPLLTCLLTR